MRGQGSGGEVSERGGETEGERPEGLGQAAAAEEAPARHQQCQPSGHQQARALAEGHWRAEEGEEQEQQGQEERSRSHGKVGKGFIKSQGSNEGQA